MTTRFAIVDATGQRVRTFHLGPTGGVLPAVDDTYGSNLECCLALIFQFGDFPELRPAPVEGDPGDPPHPMSPPQPDLPS